MANKIRYGLRNTKYAIFDPVTQTYGSVKDLPGAVSLSVNREGGDAADFYADDGIYFTFAGTNGGYSGDFEVARITDTIRVDLLGETVDSTTGIQFETTVSEAKQFALITEMQGDTGPIGFVFYNCKASRAQFNANTRNENPQVDTDTINIRMGAQPITYDGHTYQIVQGHIEKTADNTAKWNAFFSSVVVPGSIGVTGVTA